MSMQAERIRQVLGKDCQRNRDNSLRFLRHLMDALQAPCRLVCLEHFPWETPFLNGGWDDATYQALKRDNPSMADEFELLDLLPPEPGQDDLIACIRRPGDGRTFEVGLSLLACNDTSETNQLLIDDYTVWHGSY
jgi:hypothetical protein